MKKHCLLIVLAVFLASIRATRAAGDPLSVPPGFERFFLSLRVLSQKVSEAAAEKGTFPGELTNLCGMAFVQGYVLGDPDDKDIILVGLRTKRRPQLHLDDLVVNVRNIWDGNDAPYCSLDPTEESIRALRNLSRMRGDAQTIFERLQSAIGPQQTRLGGVPEESRHAHVMIDADYHMKKVSQGIISVTGLTSCLDLILEDGKRSLQSGVATGSGTRMSRFWFQVENKRPYFYESGSIVWVKECKVALRTEKQATTPDGQHYDANEDDPLAVLFAANFSKTFGGLTYSVPIYGDLDNLYRLRAMLLAMKFRSAPAVGGLDFGLFLPGFRFLNEKPMPISLPGLANYREWREDTGAQSAFLYPMVCGGVTMELIVDESSFNQKYFYELAAFRSAVLSSRLSAEKLSWTMSATSADMKVVVLAAKKLREKARLEAYSANTSGEANGKLYLSRILYEVRKLEAIDKTVVPLYSADGEIGTVDLRSEHQASIGTQLVTQFATNVVAVIPRIGNGPGLELAMGGGAKDFVFVNVGNAQIQFDGFVLETGEYASLANKRFRKVKFEEKN